MQDRTPEQIRDDSERRYLCRYEIGSPESGVTAFPVTHRLNGADRAAWMYIGVGSFEILNWRIMEIGGCTLLHSAEMNLERSREGFRRMVRKALSWVTAYGGTRVWPRSFEHRRGAIVPAWIRTDGRPIVSTELS